MKRRCFDHIDLRVKDMKVARKFYAKFLPQLGFVRESPGRKYHTFYAAGGDKPSEFFGFTQDKEHQPNGTRIAFWADTRRKWTGLRILCEKRAGELSKARKSVASTVRATTHFSSKTPTETSWRFAAGKVRSLRNERISAKS